MIAEKHYFTIDGQRIAYLTKGDPANPALMMVHGWLSHAGYWWQTFEAFHRTHYCIAIDLLGHAASDKPVEGDYSIPSQARRVLDLADHLGIPKFTLICHSMGGQIALHLALSTPERLTKLVVVSGVVTGQLSRTIRWMHTPFFWAGAKFPPVWELTRLAVKRKLRWYTNMFDRAFFYDPTALPIDTVDRHAAIDPGGEIPFYRELIEIRKVDLTPRLKEITTPTLAIIGQQDGTVPLVNGYLIQKHIPAAKLILFDRCGHSPLSEQPIQTIEALKTFLYAASSEIAHS